MGNIIKISKNPKTTKKAFLSTKKVIHKAKVLTPSDVKENRSMAYTYLNL